MRTENYLLQKLNQINLFSSKKAIHVALIGLGPHAKRIYLNYFKKHHINLALVVDVDSNRATIRSYLDENGFKQTKIFTISDSIKNFEVLPKMIFSNFLSVCKTLEITHMVIATEPKGHYMYLDFALKNHIHVLTDKPITVCKNMTSVSSIKKVRAQYYRLVHLSKTSKAQCKVMCQRQYHKGYEYVKKILNEVVLKYQIPITYIDIYHCDGNWEMPHDMDKENHPYKYGYGKLFHSGYHFIDLLSDLLKINNQLPESKQITNGEVYSNCFTPQDELAVCNMQDYGRLFSTQTLPSFYQDYSKLKFKKYGEKNFYGLFQFANKNHQTITTANLNLLHYGFSRRGWMETKNFYKENGRIRHERLNIQVGTLLNIQVHSYQSKEIKDRTTLSLEENTGGLEHFDIDIYRNVDVIGGKPFERIHLGDLYSDHEKESMLGYNELARDQFLSHFFAGTCTKGDLKDQALSIEILYSCAMGIHNHYANKKNPEKILIQRESIFPVSLNDLKRFSERKNFKQDKKMFSHYCLDISNCSYGIVINYLVNLKKYECYLYISDETTTASMLLYYESEHYLLIYLYYFYLCMLIYTKNIKFLLRKIQRTPIYQK